MEHHCEGGEVKSDLLSRESKQRVTWNLSPFVFFDSEKTGGNLTCGPPTNAKPSPSPDICTFLLPSLSWLIVVCFNLHSRCTTLKSSFVAKAKSSTSHLIVIPFAAPIGGWLLPHPPAPLPPPLFCCPLPARHLTHMSCNH